MAQLADSPWRADWLHPVRPSTSRGRRARTSSARSRLAPAGPSSAGRTLPEAESQCTDSVAAFWPFGQSREIDTSLPSPRKQPKEQPFQSNSEGVEHGKYYRARATTSTSAATTSARGCSERLLIHVLIDPRRSMTQTTTTGSRTRGKPHHDVTPCLPASPASPLFSGKGCACSQASLAFGGREISVNWDTQGFESWNPRISDKVSRSIRS